MWDRLRVLWGLMRGYRLRYGGALLALLAGVGIGYLVPLVCRATLDAAIAGKAIEEPGLHTYWLDVVGGPEALARNLGYASAALVTLTALSGIFLYFRGRLSATAAEAIARALRDRLYDHLQHLPAAYHDKANPGDLVQRCTSDVETVRAFLANQVLEIGRAVVMLGLAIPLMLWLDVRMALVSLAAVPVIVAFSFVFFMKVRAAFKLSDEAEGALTARLQENLTGIRVVRAFARQDHEERCFAEKNAAYRDRTFRLIRLLAWFWASSDFMCMAQSGLVLLFGAYWISRGEMSVGTLYAFLAWVNMFLWPVRMLGRVLTDLGKTLVSLGRLQEILTTPREADAAGAVAAAAAVTLPARGELAFEKVTFAHGQAQVLQELNLHVPAGQTLALLGPSGSGKSTLMHLLLRLYDCQGGVIRLDGHDLRELPRQFVRAQMAAVLQEPFLFSRNLRDNIRLGQAQASEEEIQAAASAACIHEAIAGFEKGYDTIVGERGVMLSGGQRQRVALARALVRDPAVLILDDALSAVDTKTESLILEALEARRGRRTTILIAHRISTLMQADRVVVLDQSRIIQDGTHDELARAEGLYRRLWRIQSSLEEDLGRELQPVAGNGNELAK